MTEENLSPPLTTDSEEVENQVTVGFHPLGGIRVQADNARLSPEDAFVLAGQLIAHSTMMIQGSYAQQARAAMEADALLQGKGVILPGR